MSLLTVFEGPMGEGGAKVGHALSAELMAAAAEMQMEVRGREGEMREWMSKYEEMKQVAQDARDGHEELSLSYRSVVAQLEEASKQCQAQERRLGAMGLQADAYAERMAAVEDGLGKAIAKREELGTQIAELVHDNEEQEEQIKVLMADVGALRKACQEAKAALEAKTQELDDAQAAALKAEAERAVEREEMSGKVVELERELGVVREALESAHTRVAGLEVERDNATLMATRAQARAVELQHCVEEAQRLATARGEDEEDEEGGVEVEVGVEDARARVRARAKARAP